MKNSVKKPYPGATITDLGQLSKVTQQAASGGGAISVSVSVSVSGP